MSTFFCVKCRRKFPISQLSQSQIIQNGNRFRIAGLCPQGDKVSRFISRADATQASQGRGIFGDILGSILPIAKPLTDLIPF